MNGGQALDILDRQQCLNLLPRVRVGRLIFFDNGDPAVHPVNFRLLRNDIVIRVAGGAKLIAALQHQKVAFQADQLDADLRKGWSVTVVGHASRLTAIDDLVTVSGNFVQPWVEGRRDQFVRISSEKVTGRRIFDASPVDPSH